MKRETITARTNALQHVATLGLLHAGNEEEPYWDESACYHFTQQQIEQIEAAAAELHVMCLRAVEQVIDNNLFNKLKIPQEVVPYIKQSWQQRDPFIYGRFDFAYDGVNPPKMLEYNADTPTSLLEAAVIQYDWLNQKKEASELPKEANQFNFIEESLMRAWQKVAKEVSQPNGMPTNDIQFACYLENLEDAQTTNYMADIAEAAGLKAEVLDISDVGSDGKNFYDANDQKISTLFKLYPWEWMFKDEYGTQAKNSQTRFIEPVWKMILSNKGILPILWELYPDHPNLLAAYDTPGKISGPYVKKPLVSREGANVSIHGTSHDEISTGDYGNEGYIYQAYAELPNYDGNFPVIGAWITSSDPTYPDMPTHPRGGEACGIGIRESTTSRITGNLSRFVPHYFTPEVG